MPLSRTWAVRISRVCPSTLALAKDLQSLQLKRKDPTQKHLSYKLQPPPKQQHQKGDSFSLPLGPPKDALEKERKHFEYASKSLWNLCEPDHVHELMEDALQASNPHRR